jgi:amidase
MSEPGIDGFIERFTIEPCAGGPLAGIGVAVKDLIDVAGHRSGCGNPYWRDTHPVATTHAVAVDLLLNAGAGWSARRIQPLVATPLAGVA